MLDSASDRSRQFRTALVARLERVRGNLTDAEFARLVSDVLNTALRFDEIDSRERDRPTSLPSLRQVLEEPEARQLGTLRASGRSGSVPG